ncbi:MAG: hypothetical protein ABSG25_16255, partial [Bryobacteraceae bacterium]
MSARRRSQESGFALLLIFAMAALVAIALYLELPRVAFEAQRNKEQILISRGGEYKRAIQLFVRKFGRYPAKIEDLENTNNTRFLRHRYKDPMTGSDEWRFIHAAPGGVFPDSITMKPDPSASPTSASGANKSSFGSSMGGSSFGQPLGQATPTPTPDNSYAYGMDPSGQNQSPGGVRRRQSDMIGLNQNQNQDPNNPNNPNVPYNPNGQYNPNGPPYNLANNPNGPYDPNAAAGQPGNAGQQPGSTTGGSQSGQMGGYSMGVPIDPSIGQAQPTPAPTPVVYNCGRRPPNSPGCQGYQSGSQGTSPTSGGMPGSGYIPAAASPANWPGFDPTSGGNANNSPPANFQSNMPNGGGFNSGGQGAAAMPSGIQQGLYSGNQSSSSPVTMGGGIAGVASTFEGPSIRVFRVNNKDFKKYSEWEFIYDPAKDTSSMAGMPNQVNIGGSTANGNGGFTPANGASSSSRSSSFSS